MSKVYVEKPIANVNFNCNGDFYKKGDVLDKLSKEDIERLQKSGDNWIIFKPVMEDASIVKETQIFTEQEVIVEETRNNLSEAIDEDNEISEQEDLETTEAKTVKKAGRPKKK
jgi:hypothetical protein